MINSYLSHPTWDQRIDDPDSSAVILWRLRGRNKYV